MAKQRLELPEDPGDIWCAACFHVDIINHGSFIEAHTCWPLQIKDLTSAWVENEEQLASLGATLPTLDYPTAVSLCQIISAYPDYLTDKCVWCHYLQPRGSLVRWNLPRGQRYPYRGPCQISPDFFWHFI